MNKEIVLFDDSTWYQLLPLTYTKPIAKLRIGINTIEEKWARYAKVSGYCTQGYLTVKYNHKKNTQFLYVNGAVMPNNNLWQAVEKLQNAQALVKDNLVIACLTTNYDPAKPLSEINETIDYQGDLNKINHVWDIFTQNGDQIKADFKALTHNKKSQAIPETNNILGAENIFIEPGAEFNFVTINATDGPVYIGRNAKILEGALIKGPMSLGEHSVIKMGAKIYGETTIGPHCKVGGEVMNSVFSGYSNKGHDGYLGNSVLGEWCNLGADTNNSNLKNNYARVKLWNYQKNGFENTNLQFCGLIMGDHSKSGINTMFNTGTVVGVSANIFGSGFPRNFIPSFTWGGAGGFSLYQLKKALETAQIVMSRRNIELSDADIAILKSVFELTEKYRKF